MKKIFNLALTTAIFFGITVLCTGLIYYFYVREKLDIWGLHNRVAGFMSNPNTSIDQIRNLAFPLSDYGSKIASFIDSVVELFLFLMSVSAVVLGYIAYKLRAYQHSHHVAPSPSKYKKLTDE